MADKSLKILMITSEAEPWVKTGGLADAVSALSAQLSRDGHDVRIILPRYYSVDRDKLTKIDAPLGVPVGYGEEWTVLYTTTLPGTEIPVYFADHELLFGRAGIYGPTPDSAFPDNAERFNMLSRSAFQVCRLLDWIPDILHCHDWVAGPVSLYNQTLERHTEFARTASVMTIHNLGYQGDFPAEKSSCFAVSHQEIARRFGYHHGALNFLKMGIENAEIVTTVSPTYAQEIQTAEYGFGLDGALRYRRNDLFGILNGVDYSAWNPETDKLIPVNYTEKSLKRKEMIKTELQKHFGLEVNPALPVFGIVSRMVEQKGFGALCGPTYGSLYNMCRDMDIQFVILGSGESWCEQELTALAARLPNLRVHIGYSNQLSHLIEAGSDFFLMPSRYEPCGLNQMYSLKYGTLPIVRHTGGLADTVENYNEETGEGTGFMFNDLTPVSIYNTVGWAVHTWYNKRADIEKMRKRAMKKDFSWKDSSAQYEKIYHWALDRRLGRYP
jgi:starch synthase